MPTSTRGTCSTTILIHWSPGYSRRSDSGSLQRVAAGAADAEKVAKVAKADGEQGGDGWFELKNNTSVYVTGLPYEVTVDEIAAEFGKCGVIRTDDEGKPRIKLYTCAPQCPALALLIAATWAAARRWPVGAPMHGCLGAW